MIPFLSGHADWDVEPLSITSGVIWTALNIDYPGHSFSHLGVFRGAAYRFVGD
jgi:glycosylphosphatidylinositol transamidase